MYENEPIFIERTIEGFNLERFPKNFFDKPIAKDRCIVLLKHICELDGRDVLSIYLELNDNWIEQYKLDKIERNLHIEGSTRLDRIVKLFQTVFPELPIHDLSEQVIRWHNEIRTGRRVGYPERCFEGKTGRERALALLKYAKSHYNLNEHMLTEEILNEYDLNPLVPSFAKNVEKLQVVYNCLSV